MRGEGALQNLLYKMYWEESSCTSIHLANFHLKTVQSHPAARESRHVPSRSNAVNSCTFCSCHNCQHYELNSQNLTFTSTLRKLEAEVYLRTDSNTSLFSPHETFAIELSSFCFLSRTLPPLFANAKCSNSHISVMRSAMTCFISNMTQSIPSNASNANLKNQKQRLENGLHDKWRKCFDKEKLGENLQLCEWTTRWYSHAEVVTESAVCSPIYEKEGTEPL